MLQFYLFSDVSALSLVQMKSLGSSFSRDSLFSCPSEGGFFYSLLTFKEEIIHIRAWLCALIVVQTGGGLSWHSKMLAGSLKHSGFGPRSSHLSCCAPITWFCAEGNGKSDRDHDQGHPQAFLSLTLQCWVPKSLTILSISNQAQSTKQKGVADSGQMVNLTHFNQCCQL